MEQLIIIGIFAFGASLLTFFSGFGLGTILTPVFALFFDLPEAITLTAIVHLLNNILKFGLIGKHIDKQTIIKFGIPAAFMAVLGAEILGLLEDLPVLYEYQLFDKTFEIEAIKLIVGILIMIFAIIEWAKLLKKYASNNLIFGGMLSGFFGGLSGHQGALRSMFLIQLNFSKETYIATGTAIACLIDIGRLTDYGGRYYHTSIMDKASPLGVAIICAFAGAFIGKKALKKVTIDKIHVIVSILLIAMGIGLGTGLI